MLNNVVPLYRDPITGYWNLYYKGAGELGLLSTHSEDSCTGYPCDIHNRPPHMSKFPLQWRRDRKILEQVCKHGVGHPSPGEVAHSVRKGRRALHLEHGCDGCCEEWNERS